MFLKVFWAWRDLIPIRGSTLTSITNWTQRRHVFAELGQDQVIGGAKEKEKGVINEYCFFSLWMFKDSSLFKNCHKLPSIKRTIKRSKDLISHLSLQYVQVWRILVAFPTGLYQSWFNVSRQCCLWQCDGQE